jgi:hypothetical protein
MATLSNLLPATLTWPQKTQFQSYDGMKFNASEANAIPVAVNNHAAILTFLLTQQQPPTVVEFNPQTPNGYFGPNANGTGASQVFYIQNGITDYYTAKQRLTLAAFPSGLPAPSTGGASDPYWALASPPAAEYQPLQVVTVRQMRDYLVPQAQLKPGRYYRLTRYLEDEGGGDGGLSQAPDRAEFDVVLLALTEESYAPTAWAVDNTTSVITEGTYDLAEDEFTAQTYVLSNDARLNDARRIIQARTLQGVYYTATDGNLAAAIAAAGNHGLISMQQVYDVTASFVLQQGQWLYGNHRFFRLDSHRITLPSQSGVFNLKPEYIAATGGDFYSEFGADNANTPRLVGCELRVDVHVAAGCFLRLVDCDIIGNNWNKGAGTILLENCREFGTRGSGTGFSVVDDGADDGAAGASLSDAYVLAGTKRQQVAYANQVLLPEPDEAFVGQCFVDTVTLPGRAFRFVCEPVGETSGATLFYWIRTEIPL